MIGTSKSFLARPYSVPRGLVAFLAPAIIGVAWAVIGIPSVTLLIVFLSSLLNSALHRLSGGLLPTWSWFTFPLFWLAGLWGIWKMGAVFLARRIGFLGNTFGNNAPIFQRLDAHLASTGYSLAFWVVPTLALFWLYDLLSHVKWPC